MNDCFLESDQPVLADTGYKQQPESKGRLLISKLPFPKRDFLQYDLPELAKTGPSDLLQLRLRAIHSFPSVSFPNENPMPIHIIAAVPVQE